MPLSHETRFDNLLIFIDKTKKGVHAIERSCFRINSIQRWLRLYKKKVFEESYNTFVILLTFRKYQNYLIRFISLACVYVYVFIYIFKVYSFLINNK